MDNVKIVENNVESEVVALAYLKISGKNILFYSLNDFTEDGLAKLRISATNNENNTFTPEEWTNVTNAVRSIIEGSEVENVEYMKLDAGPFELGQVKKLAVKPEWKTAFTDHVAAHLIENNTPNVSGNENPQMPFFDPAIDTSNKEDLLPNQEVVANPFDNSIKPDVPEAAIATEEVKETSPAEPTETAALATDDVVIDPTMFEAPTEPTLTDAPSEVAEPVLTDAPAETTLVDEVAPVEPAIEPAQAVSIEPVETTPVETVKEEVKEEVSMNKDNVKELLIKVEELEKAVQNIKDILNNMDGSSVEAAPAETTLIETPTDSAFIEPTADMAPVEESPVVEAVEPANAPAEPTINPEMFEAPAAPVEPAPMNVEPVQDAFITQPTEPAPAAVAEPAPVEAAPVDVAPATAELTVPTEEEPAFISQPTEPAPQANFVPDVSAIPDVAPSVVPEISSDAASGNPISSSAFAGMSPTTI